jgi:hypothetical protein
MFFSSFEGGARRAEDVKNKQQELKTKNKYHDAI